MIMFYVGWSICSIVAFLLIMPALTMYGYGLSYIAVILSIIAGLMLCILSRAIYLLILWLYKPRRKD